MNLWILGIIFFVYFAMTGYVGYIAWKNTKSSEDFMIAGKNSHPYIMALSYGATFISTAAIVGFGGLAGQYGMSLLWLVFLNIFVGIFIAFAVFGKRTRKMGHSLGSLTFPDFLAKRFDSKFIQTFSGLIIFCFMPLYAAVVLIGGARFIESSLMLDFNLALLILVIVVGLYVLFGGIKGVMYTDAFQGTIMMGAMVILLVSVYWILGGVQEANLALTNMAHLYPASEVSMGGTGWTSFPTAGSPFWWTLVSSTLVGVGIGVLAQPQLIVRFMTVKSDKELHRSVLIGGIFIALIPGTAYIVGALSNVYFFDTLGKIAIDVVGGNVDKIIPVFISMALPEWFVYIFLLSLLAAVMSTISSQFHTQGTAFGIDILGSLRKKSEEKTNKISTARIGIIIAVFMALILGLLLPGGVIALGTSIFFEICAAAFLPMFIAALFWKRASREGAIAGMVSGTLISLFWLVFVFSKTAKGLGICEFLTGQPYLISAYPWPFIDVMFIAVPISAIFVVVVSLLTKPVSDDVINKAFVDIDNKVIE